MTKNEDLEKEFDSRMLSIYQRANKECGYNATRFLQMLEEHRGLKTAKILIEAPKVSEGFTRLSELKRLDLTVEALVLEPKWAPLFSAEEIQKARERLEE